MYRSHIMGYRFIRHLRRLVVQNEISQRIALLPFHHKILMSMLSGSGLVLFSRGVNLIQAATVEDQDTTIINEANSLYESGAEPRQLYDYLKRYKSSKNAEILWRFARAARDLVLSGKVTDGEEKKALSYEAFEASKQALEEDDTNYGSHKWYAITLSDLGDYEGTKMKIANAYTIKEHFEKALEINPNDATTAHCMGMWCLAFAELSWYKQKIAALLFATPPTSTYAEAINMFVMAERIDPGFYSVNLFQLGKCYKATGDVRRAMLYLDKASNYPAKTREDEETVAAAKKLLEELIKENKK